MAIPADSRGDKTRRLLRLHSLGSGLMSIVASLVLFASHFPYSGLLAVISVFAAVVYLGYFSVFEILPEPLFRRASVAVSQVGVVIVTAAVYFTGGIVSPFIFLYFALLMSESVYGLENSYTVPLSLAGYLGTAAFHFWGLGPETCTWSETIYDSPLAVLLIVVLTSGYLVMVRGITARIVANLRSRIELEEGEKAGLLKRFSELDSSAQIGALAHRIAHDLRAPLSSISGYVQMELMRARSPEGRAQLEALDQTVDAMAQSLVNITAFGKKTGMPAERLSLPDFFRQLLAIAAYSPLARGVRFHKDFDDGTDAWVSASRSDLQQAYFNLVKNALEATQDNASGREVSVSIRRYGREIEVVVADNGPGIPAEVLKNLFRKSITTKSGGTGVGLVITRDLLARNDASLELRNRAGGGFEAVTRLPAVN